MKAVVKLLLTEAGKAAAVEIGQTVVRELTQAVKKRVEKADPK